MPYRKKILFIINPISGVGKKNAIPPLIEKHLAPSKFDWKIRYTEKRNHAAEIAFHEKDNFDAIIAVGGDGSVNEVGSALIGSNCALGIIPCGSGNGIARHLNVPLKPEPAIIRITAFNPTIIDTGIVNDIPFIGTCGFAFDAHIAKCFDSFGKRGLLSYARLVTREYKRYVTPTFTIKGKGIEITRKAILCSVANSSQFGNGFTISPNSDIQDGIFELVFLDRFNWLIGPEIARKFFTKSIQTSKLFSSYSFSDELTITVEDMRDFYFHIDGEPIKGESNFVIRVNPKSLSII